MGVANTTFIMMYARLMRDLPFERPERVAIVRTLDGRGREGGVSYPDFEDFRQDAQVFYGRAAAFAINTISLGRDGAVPEQFDGLYVSADTFTVLRVTPVIGRDFSGRRRFGNATHPYASYAGANPFVSTRRAATWR